MKYTDNVRFNHKLNWIMILMSFILFSSAGEGVWIAVIRSIVFTGIYAFSSAFIQPDLDHTVYRPGKESFPLGSLSSSKIGKVISPIFYPINRLWYFFWAPYGHLLTHRGISHWPIIGTWTRAGYVLIVLFGLKFVLKINYLDPVIEFLKTFFPNKDYEYGITINWCNYVLPVFIADIIHFIVDLFDSFRNNTKFASYAHEPGLLTQALNPKILKYHKKALRKAKSNSKKRSRKQNS